MDAQAQTTTRPRCEHCQSENLVPLQVEPGSHTESGAIVTAQEPAGVERQYRCADCHRITVINNMH
jgi:DNA-directed RNA polymerase subunit RPC12/RpoP